MDDATVAPDRHLEMLALTADIVSAHASNNSLSLDELVQMIADVFHTLEGIHKTDKTGRTDGRSPHPPAVPIKKSANDPCWRRKSVWASGRKRPKRKDFAPFGPVCVRDESRFRPRAQAGMFGCVSFATGVTSSSARPVS